LNWVCSKPVEDIVLQRDFGAIPGPAGSKPRPLIRSLASSNARKTRPRVVFGESRYDKRVSLTRQVARGRALEPNGNNFSSLRGNESHARQAKDLDHGITEGTESRNFRDSMLSALPCSRASRARRLLVRDAARNVSDISSEARPRADFRTRGRLLELFSVDSTLITSLISKAFCDII